MKIINNNLYNIFIAISISIILRMLLINTYGDLNLENEWGVLFNNLKNNGVLAYISLEGYLIPSVYMPPLYVYFIYLVDLVTPDNFDLVRSILLVQILLSAISVFYFYKINLNLFNKKLSIISTYIFILFPINVYACLQISSISLQIFLTIIFVFNFKNFYQKTNVKNLYIFKLNFWSYHFTKGRVYNYIFFTIIYLLLLKKLNFIKVAIIILVTSIIISPYLVRNYLVFEKITITKSFGYNLWKGNNITSTVEGSESSLAFDEDQIKQKIDNLEKDNLYEFSRDKIFLDISLDYINDNKVLFIKRYIKKFLTFLLYSISIQIIPIITI